MSSLASDTGSLALPTPAFASKQGKELLTVSPRLSPGSAPRTPKTSIRGAVDLLLYILEHPFPGEPPDLLSTLVATINVFPHPSVTCATRNMEASLSGRFQGMEFPRKCLVERLAGQLVRGRSFSSIRFAPGARGVKTVKAAVRMGDAERSELTFTERSLMLNTSHALFLFAL